MKASASPESLPPAARQLLFICSQNQWRSPTAELLFKNHPHYLARSAGTEAGARVRVTAGLLGWADAVLVMERRHADRLREKFTQELAGKPLLVLRIPDNYRFGDAPLLALLQAKLEPLLPLL